MFQTTSCPKQPTWLASVVHSEAEPSAEAVRTNNLSATSRTSTLTNILLWAFQHCSRGGHSQTGGGEREHIRYTPIRHDVKTTDGWCERHWTSRYSATLCWKTWHSCRRHVTIFQTPLQTNNLPVQTYPQWHWSPKEATLQKLRRNCTKDVKKCF